MQNMQQMMKQAQKMQAKLMKAQEEIQAKEVEGTAGGGMVKIIMTGSQQMKSITLNKDAVDPDDVEMLEDLIMAAYTNAFEQAKQLNESTMGAITGGMKLPGF